MDPAGLTRGPKCVVRLGLWKPQRFRVHMLPALPRRRPLRSCLTGLSGDAAEGVPQTRPGKVSEDDRLYLQAAGSPFVFKNSIYRNKQLKRKIVHRLLAPPLPVPCLWPPSICSLHPRAECLKMREQERSSGMCLSLPDVFHLARRPRGPSALLQTAGFVPFMAE